MNVKFERYSYTSRWHNHCTLGMSRLLINISLRCKKCTTGQIACLILYITQRDKVSGFTRCTPLRIIYLPYTSRSWKDAFRATRAISTTSRRELSWSSLFPARQGDQGITRHSERNIREHAPSYATIKNWVAPFKRGDFPTCVAPRPGRPKTVTTPEIIDQIHESFYDFP